MSTRKKDPDRRDVVVRMPAYLHEAIKRQADIECRPMAEVIRSALWAYVQPTDPERR